MAIQMQKTLRTSVSIQGTSLHTGQPVKLTIKPADVNTGLKFRRIDLPDKPFIDASAANVQTVERATTLAEGSVNVHTVEHILSALTGMGVDNAIIEMDANEPPIGDGSAAPYVELIKKAGLEEQDAPCQVWEIREPVMVENKSGSMIVIMPDRQFRVSVTVSGPEGRVTQYFHSVITPETYEKELSRARTFCFYEDIQPLLDKGLIKGGTLDNAIVIKGEQYICAGGLRYHNECARHKTMDMIGDLILNGRRILGHVIAVMPGHGINTTMAAKLQKTFESLQAMRPKPMTLPAGDTVLDTNEVLKLLPHRYPFLMVDRVIGFEGDTKCIGQKNLTMNELFFQGHFPGHPVMPGVLQLEAMAQVASILMLRIPENMGKIGYFMSCDKVKWRKPVVPGDVLIIETELVKMRGAIGVATGRCLVNGEVTCEAELKFMVQDA
ncbi:MAG TPA: bifunctional UDP-3-O-[3-hydroxymyristoyl] N-acetylglucosamine deacetylase/3-hydroxyacyl-ACP dehydratase [Candidatus Akkermansia intestinavium]|nr:bifunctional UDP-3-O-[3-hydroxymyristoyl] N-acetylglucosamine deacetylase/3-hydroxyacyl-ACP dehydratase [Candidatus Akkermansia intestinavium]